ncbi:hypothetical protein RZS08_67520, partial [Arthrospira platensis SPKY1]|nr:hypothetical protein [Arthrospira platensis SPKY1]
QVVLQKGLSHHFTRSCHAKGGRQAMAEGQQRAVAQRPQPARTEFARTEVGQSPPERLFHGALAVREIHSAPVQRRAVGKAPLARFPSAQLHQARHRLAHGLATA